MVILLDYVCDEIIKLQALAEPRIKDWIITKSIWNVFGIIAVYLYSVYVIGPAFMRGRKAYNLKKILIVYNILQIILNLYIIYASISVGWLWKYKFVCEPIDYSTSPHGFAVLNGMWHYFLLKILDLADTFFFVLRKKQNQVTFLHIYHHSGMILLVWMAIVTTPGGHGVLLGLVNGFAHVIMYSYYLFASFKFGNIWWKKYVTQVQILQFILVTIQCTLGLLKKDCSYSKIAISLFLPHIILIMVLFIKFYINTYMNKNEKSSEIDRNNVSNKTDDNNVNSSSNKKIKIR